MPAFDPAIHGIDPVTGYQIDKESGTFSGLVQKTFENAAEAVSDFPKWVVASIDHIVMKQDGDGPVHVSTPDFPDFHVNRETKEVTVLVHDEDEEKKAVSGKQSPAPEPHEFDDPDHSKEL